MAQLALLLFRVGANEATDTYFYLFNLGMVPITGIITGVMYPSLLNEVRLSHRDLSAIRWLTPVCCVVIAGAGVAWLAWNDRFGAELAPLAVLTITNTIAQSRLWYRAVAAEAGGDPTWIAGIALVPNTFATLALLFPWPSAAVAVSAMVTGLVLGNIGILGWMMRHDVGDVVLRRPIRSASRRGSVWFFSMASVEFIGQTVLQSLAVLLPASSITLLNVAYKVVGSVSATFVNASMPLLVHADTDSPRLAGRFLRFVTVAVAAGAILTTIGFELVRPEYLIPVTVVAAWLVTSSASAVAHRMSFRFLTPTTASTRTMTVIAVVVGAAALSTRAPGFDLTVLLCAYAAMDGASATLLLWPLKDRVMSIVLGTLLLAIVCVWTIVALH